MARSYVQNSSVADLDFKQSARVATTANITLSGTQTVDGVSLSVGDRVIVKNQTTTSQNGIYVVQSSSWTRSVDAAENSQVTSGMMVFAEEGSTNASTFWRLSTANPITVGSTGLTFVNANAGRIVPYATSASFPSSGSSDYYYLDIDTGRIYQWTGSYYAEIGPSM